MVEAKQKVERNVNFHAPPASALLCCSALPSLSLCVVSLRLAVHSERPFSRRVSCSFRISRSKLQLQSKQRLLRSASSYNVCNSAHSSIQGSELPRVLLRIFCSGISFHSERVSFRLFSSYHSAPPSHALTLTLRSAVRRTMHFFPLLWLAALLPLARKPHSLLSYIPRSYHTSPSCPVGQLLPLALTKRQSSSDAYLTDLFSAITPQCSSVCNVFLDTIGNCVMDGMTDDQIVDCSCSDKVFSTVKACADCIAAGTGNRAPVNNYNGSSSRYE